MELSRTRSNRLEAFWKCSSFLWLVSNIIHAALNYVISKDICGAETIYIRFQKSVPLKGFADDKRKLPKRDNRRVLHFSGLFPISFVLYRSSVFFKRRFSFHGRGGSWLRCFDNKNGGSVHTGSLRINDLLSPKVHCRQARTDFVIRWQNLL